MTDRYRDNERLLDNGGVWIYCRDEAVASLKNKIVVGFMEDSHRNVIGKYGGGMNHGISGYACSHYRLLNKAEVAEYCMAETEEPKSSESKIQKTDLDLRDIALNMALETFMSNPPSAVDYERMSLKQFGEDYSAWQPFEHWSTEDVCEEIEKTAFHIESTLKIVKEHYSLEDAL